MKKEERAELVRYLLVQHPAGGFDPHGALLRKALRYIQNALVAAAPEVDLQTLFCLQVGAVDQNIQILQQILLFGGSVL